MSDQCAICRNGEFAPVAEKLRDGSSGRRVFACSGCGHIQLLPRPTPKEDKTFYDTNGQDKAVRLRIDVGWERRNFEIDTQRRAGFVEDIAPAGSSILDVGAGYGFFLAEMSRRGFEVTGIEVSEERRGMAGTVTEAKLYSLNLVLEEATGLALSDIVTTFHVLEHIADPIGFLVKLKGLLRSSGTVVCEVPNVEEQLIEVCPEYRDFYWIRAHLSYFSSSTLRLVFERAGFANVEVLHVQRYGVENLCSWLSTGQPQLDSPRFQITPDYRWLEEAYRNKLSKAGQTDTLMVVARK